MTEVPRGKMCWPSISRQPPISSACIESRVASRAHACSATLPVVQHQQVVEVDLIPAKRKSIADPAARVDQGEHERLLPDRSSSLGSKQNDLLDVVGGESGQLPLLLFDRGNPERGP